MWPLRVVLLCEIDPQEVSVCRTDAEWKVVRSSICKSLLPACGQSLVAVVSLEQRNHTSDGSLGGQAIVGALDVGQPHENVAIGTFHDYRLMRAGSLLPPGVATGKTAESGTRATVRRQGGPWYRWRYDGSGNNRSLGRAVRNDESDAWGSPHWVRSVSQRDVVDLVGLAPPEGVISW